MFTTVWDDERSKVCRAVANGGCGEGVKSKAESASSWSTATSVDGCLKLAEGEIEAIDGWEELARESGFSGWLGEEGLRGLCLVEGVGRDVWLGVCIKYRSMAVRNLKKQSSTTENKDDCRQKKLRCTLLCSCWAK